MIELIFDKNIAYIVPIIILLYHSIKHSRYCFNLIIYVNTNVPYNGLNGFVIQKAKKLVYSIFKIALCIENRNINNRNGEKL